MYPEPFDRGTVQDQGEMHLSNDEKPKGARIIDWQLKRPEYGEALRSYYKPFPHDEKFEDLLRRLDEAEVKSLKPGNK
jgi:hypothetical protein